MVLIEVMVKPKADVFETFESTLRGIVEAARASVGCTHYHWYRDPEGEGTYFIYGAFETQTAFANYHQSDVVKHIGSELLPLLSAKPAFRHYEATVFESNH